MAMHGSLFAVEATAYQYEPGAHPRPLDSEGQPMSGYIRVTELGLPIPADADGPERHVLYAASGMPLLEGAVPGGYDSAANGPWEPAALVLAYPVAHTYVMEREYTDGTLAEDGSLVVHRQKMARALPLLASVVREQVVGFHWTDDAP
jgi:hypothetical protein